MLRIARFLPLLLLAVVTFPAICAGPAIAAGGLIVTHRIPAALALEAVGATVAACAAKGYQESAVLLDANGNTQASLRGDGAGLTTLENADHKAYTAVSYNEDTGAIVARAAAGGDTSPAINRFPRLIMAQGAVVIKVNGEVVGALGASGAPGGEKDEACARAGVAKIAGQLK